MKPDSVFISPMNAQSEKKKSSIILSLLSMDWKGILIVAGAFTPIFWLCLFSKTDERYLKRDDYLYSQKIQADAYQKDQAEMKNTLVEMRQEQKEQRQDIKQLLRDNAKK